MEGWREFQLTEEFDIDRISDILTRLRDLDGREDVTAGDIKFLVSVLGRQIATGGKFLKELEKGALEAGIDVGTDALPGLKIIAGAGKLVANLGKRAKIKTKGDAEVMASLMLIDDAAATQNPILDMLNVHDSYEGTVNPLLNGPFVEFAWEDLGSLSDTEVLPSTYGTDIMKQFLEKAQSLKTEPAS
tara:strand:- start:12 stop:575 length:564 start_codon:yes stop_codon:yes gene_type:complete